MIVFTHDAMGDGEDGPTHQPVEQLASLRAIPGLVVMRPGDANEVVEAYRYVVQLRHQPAVLVLSRQPLPTLDRTRYAAASGVARGAYVLADAPGGKPEVILIATGSELSLAVDAHEQLLADGVRSRVVSMPSWDVFERQPREYRDAVLPPGITARVAVEQASTFGWERYVGREGRVLGMETFGESAPLKELQKKFGFEPARVVALAREVLREEVAMRVVIGSDHAGFELKSDLAAYLQEQGHDVLDVGTDGPAPVDYPDFAEAVGSAVLARRAERGVLLCGSGVGAAVAANKLPGIRAGLCHDTYAAHQGVEHDDMNVLVLGGLIVGRELARELVRVYLAASYAGGERHQRRLDKIGALERKYGAPR